MFGVMRTKDVRKAAARKIVTARLRQFFATLSRQMGEGTMEVWQRVQVRLAARKPSDEHDPSGLR